MTFLRHWILLLAVDLAALCLIVLNPPMTSQFNLAFDRYGYSTMFIFDARFSSQWIDQYRMAAVLLIWICISCIVWIRIPAKKSTMIKLNAPDDAFVEEMVKQNRESSMFWDLVKRAKRKL